MKYQLENKLYSVSFISHGAELRSIIRKSDGYEYMWCGDPAYWGRVSPVLFPFVGKLKESSYIYAGQVYSGIPQHGFARDLEFSLLKLTEDEILFELLPDSDLIKCYPFQFRLQIGYQLSEFGIKVIWTVINEDSKDVYFSIGGHPAFSCPEGLDHYSLRLNSNEKSFIECSLLNKDGTLSAQKKRVFLQNSTLALSDELFKDGALIIPNQDPKSKVYCISLLDKSDAEIVSIVFDTPVYGLWSPEGKCAPFVCIEPWYGRCDSETFAGTLSQRDFEQRVLVGDTWTNSYEIVL